VYRSTETASCTSDFDQFAKVGSTSGTSYTDPNLSQENYYYCVKACDSANSCSAVSSTVTGYPDGKYTEPAPLVTEPSTISISARRAVIKWVTTRNADSRVAYGIRSNEYFEAETAKSDQQTEHIIALENLAPGTTYYYKAKWTDEDGNIGVSTEKTFTTTPPPVVKEASSLYVGIDSAVITFVSENASGVKLYYGVGEQFTNTTEMSTSPLESSYNMVLSDLEDGSKYYYRLDAIDSEGYQYTGDVYSFTTLPRPEISNVRIEEVKGTSTPTVEVTWESNTEVSSILEYSPIDDQEAILRTVSIDMINGEHKIEVSGLLTTTQYQLVVKGFDKLGNEAKSNTHFFTTSTDTRPPKISQIKIEGAITTMTSNNGEAEAQLVISWNTDELSTSQVEFDKGSSGTYLGQKTQVDANYTYNHVVVVSNLDPSSAYRLKAVSQDKAGNMSRSGIRVSITPKATDSAINLVIRNLSDIFNFVSF